MGRCRFFLIALTLALCSIPAAAQNRPIYLCSGQRTPLRLNDTTVVRHRADGSLCLVYVTVPTTPPPVVTPPTTPPVAGANEPSGMTKLTEFGFNCATRCEGWNFWEPSYGGAASLISDPAAPRSPPNVVAQNFTSALSGGSSPGTFSPDMFAQRQTIYVALWMKLSANYVGHTSSVNKVLHFYTRAGTGSNNVAIFNVRGAGTGILVPAFLLQGMAMGQGNINLDPSPATCTTVRGRWYKYEMILTNNTPGSANGRAELWADGVKCVDRSGLAFVGAGQINTWETVRWSPTYGGAEAANIATTFQEIVDHVYISGR